eukprot:CAMPEP_0179340812 /NCGR_PEP_ID=MMETSP0797-20121207/69484_1 /TAXON_ID=47934 /ORGANISM="Dinophysis acuminata, Strain DAEP01" /LENGTH=63 /DNA_ID=CAMNT_0021054807 /DNA_START=19 /DNA_END=207 /DNA_ORIENTATION=-
MASVLHQGYDTGESQVCLCSLQLRMGDHWIYQDELILWDCANTARISKRAHALSKSEPHGKFN